MQFLKVFIFILFSLILSPAQSETEILQFKARIGFTETDSRIVAQKFFDGDRKLVLIGKKTIQFWDVPNARLIETRLHEIPDLEKFDTIVTISPDAKKAIVLDSFNWRLIRKEKKVSASAYDLQTGKLLTVLQRPNESIRDAEWSENGKTLVTYSEILNDKRTEICFWNGDDFTFRASILLKGNLGLRFLSKDGERFFSSAENAVKFLTSYKYERNTAVWNTKNGKVEQNFNSNFGRENPNVYSFPQPLSPNGKFLIAPSQGRISVWQIGVSDLPKYIITAAEEDKWFLFKGFSDDGRFVIAFQNKTLEFYDVETGKLETSLPNTKSYESVKLLADGKTLVMKNCDRADIFNLKTQQKLYEIKLVCKEDFSLLGSSLRDVDVLRFHPNLPFLLTYSDKTVRVWNVENGALVQTIIDPNRIENKRKDNNKDDGLGRAASWIINGEYLFASGADGKTILLWEIKK